MGAEPGVRRGGGVSAAHGAHVTGTPTGPQRGSPHPHHRRHRVPVGALVVLPAGFVQMVRALEAAATARRRHACALASLGLGGGLLGLGIALLIWELSVRTLATFSRYERHVIRPGVTVTSTTSDIMHRRLSRPAACSGVHDEQQRVDAVERRLRRDVAPIGCEVVEASHRSSALVRIRVERRPPPLACCRPARAAAPTTRIGRRRRTRNRTRSSAARPPITGNATAANWPAGVPGASANASRSAARRRRRARRGSQRRRSTSLAIAAARLQRSPRRVARECGSRRGFAARRRRRRWRGRHRSDSTRATAPADRPALSRRTPRCDTRPARADVHLERRHRSTS